MTNPMPQIPTEDALLAALRQLRQAIGELQKNRCQIIGFTCRYGISRIEIRPPRGDALHGYASVIRHTAHGKEIVYAANVGGCTVNWTIRG